MWHYVVTKKANNQGFTLLEMLIAIAIASILGATMIPNLLSWYNQNQVKAGIETVASAVQEVKLQAQRQSKSCTMVIENNQLKTNINGCLATSRKLPNQVTLATNITGTPPAINFSHKGIPMGLTTTDPTVNIGVIVIAMDQGTDEKRCLLISDGLGMVRSGVYQGDLSNVTQEKCVAN